MGLYGFQVGWDTVHLMVLKIASFTTHNCAITIFSGTISGLLCTSFRLELCRAEQMPRSSMKSLHSKTNLVLWGLWGLQSIKVRWTTCFVLRRSTYPSPLSALQTCLYWIFGHQSSTIAAKSQNHLIDHWSILNHTNRDKFVWRRLGSPRKSVRERHQNSDALQDP